MKKLFYVCCFCLLALAPAWAQNTATKLAEYKALKAAELLLARKSYDRALLQAEAAETLGEEQGDLLLQAMALRLQATIREMNPSATGRDRVQAAKLLKESTLLLQELGSDSLINANLQQLWRLADNKTAQNNPNLTTDRTRRKGIRERVDSMALANETMAAIVATQETALTELTEQQYRQLLRLSDQDRQLDSLAINQLQDSLLLAQQELQLRKQNNELSGERIRRNFFIVLAGAVGLIALAFFSRYRISKRYQSQLEEKNKAIDTERQRSDELLLNILPDSIAEELKNNGRAAARHYDSVSVLFSDFVGFSKLAQQNDPAVLVEALDTAFRAFDEITRNYQLEKIKTIGDAYMCASGIPDPSNDHAARTVLAALAMQDWLAQHPFFQARIGIHTGPVVAGVVGSHKFAYDIWGDTVNLAARLEEAGVPGKVNVSSAVCELLDETFIYTLRGKMPVKNAGEMEMYFVQASELSTTAYKLSTKKND